MGDAPRDNSRLEAGVVLAGKYRLTRKLAEGGMGVVWVAHHLTMGHQVAIKVLQPELVGRDEAAARFRREARAAVQLRSDHVARVYDVDTLADGTLYMVMELLEGESLEDAIADRGPMPIDLTVDYLLQMLSALIEAHARGIVHRDLKPSNLFLSRDGRGTTKLKVLDFGISKVPNESSDAMAALTATSDVLGTPAYMSPEQVVSSKHVDGRSDLWAVAVIAYEMLTGEMLFAGETPGAVLAAVLNQPLHPLRERRRDVPKVLDAIVARCLERDRAERFDSARDLYQALLPLAHAAPAATSSDQHMADTLPLPQGEAAPQAAPITALTWGRGERRQQAERGSQALIATVVLVAALGAGAIWLAARDEGDGASPATSAVTPDPTETMSEPAQPEPASDAPSPTAAASSSASAAATASASSAVGAARPVAPGKPKRNLKLDERK